MYNRDMKKGSVADVSDEIAFTEEVTQKKETH